MDMITTIKTGKSEKLFLDRTMKLENIVQTLRNITTIADIE